MALTAARPTLGSVRSLRSGLTPARPRLTVRGNSVCVAASKEQAVGEEASSPEDNLLVHIVIIRASLSSKLEVIFVA
jgi:hypothetical protein